MRSTPSGAQRASTPRSSTPRSSTRRIVAAALTALLVLAFGAAPTATAVENTADAPWLTVEAYYLKLVNCTRTGGWVRTDGTCSGYGSGRYSKYVAPLKLHAGISSKVARPWAKHLAVDRLCTHGDPGARLRKAGFSSYRWGENIGCRDGFSTARGSVLATHLYFQKEKSTNGGHWRNIKNAAYKYIGIGVWRAGSRTRLVTDFYAPG